MNGYANDSWPSISISGNCMKKFMKLIMDIKYFDICIEGDLGEKLKLETLLSVCNPLNTKENWNVGLKIGFIYFQELSLHAKFTIKISKDREQQELSFQPFGIATTTMNSKDQD